MKQCSVCKETKSNNEFSRNKCSKDGLQSRCKLCQNKKTKEHYNNNKNDYKTNYIKRKHALREWFFKIKSNTGCLVCGEKDSACIDVHHLDPVIKDRTISRIFRDSMSVTQIIDELLKCVPLCANCHRKYHSGSGKDTEQIRKIVDSIKLPYDWKISEFKFP